MQTSLTNDAGRVRTARPAAFTQSTSVLPFDPVPALRSNWACDDGITRTESGYEVAARERSGSASRSTRYVTMRMSSDRVAPPSHRERTRRFVIDMPGDLIAGWVKHYRFAAAAWN